MKRRTAVFLLTLCALVLPAFPGRAYPVPPLLRSDHTTGNAWVRYTITVPDNTYLEVGIEGRFNDTRLGGLGIWSGEQLDNFGSFVYMRWSNANHASIRTAPTGEIAGLGAARFTSGDGGISEGIYGAAATYTFIAMTTQDGSFDGDFVIRGDEGISINAVEFGPARVFGEEGFAPMMHAETSAAPLGSIPFVGEPSASVRGTAAGEIATEVHDGLFGWFSPGGGVAGWDAPDGMHLGDTVLSNASPGAYRFHLEATVGSQPAWLMMADVPVS